MFKYTLWAGMLSSLPGLQSRLFWPSAARLSKAVSYHSTRHQRVSVCCICIISLLSVKQSPLPSRSPGSGSMMIPSTTTTPRIRSTSRTNPGRKRLRGTPSMIPNRTWTSSLIQNPRSPGRGKECGLSTWASTCTQTRLPTRTRSSTSKTLFPHRLIFSLSLVTVWHFSGWIF